MSFSSSAVDRCEYRLEITARLIAVGLTARPFLPTDTSRTSKPESPSLSIPRPAHPIEGTQMPLIAAEYPLLNIVWTMLVFFGLVIWLRLLFTVFGDVFSRHDISGWAKAGWCVLSIILPFVGVLLYLGTQGEGIAARNAERLQAAQSQVDQYVRDTAGSSGATQEIANAKQLLDSGAISQAEFDTLKQKALA